MLDPEAFAFAAGERVVHAEFGAGAVLSAAGPRITVSFATAGERTVHGRYLSAETTGGG